MKLCYYGYRYMGTMHSAMLRTKQTETLQCIEHYGVRETRKVDFTPHHTTPTHPHPHHHLQSYIMEKWEVERERRSKMKERGRDEGKGARTQREEGRER